jgi:ubiquinone biosynthesis protein|tara:strand:- start:837 stop:2363 length:1527 start_codon:yes stop_codon:yes gene_type:complete
MNILRFIFVLYIAIKFKLDEFIDSKPTKILQFIFFPFRILNNDKSERSVRLRMALEALGPIFIKFGQMLSTRRDLLPIDIANELAKLQDQVPPFSYNVVELIAEKAYKTTIKKQFLTFDETPIASASVAQVHFAKLHSGEEVAVKILRPNIHKEIKKNLQLLKWIATILQYIWSDGKRLRPIEIVNEFAKHTDSELNLLLEAGHCSHLGENFKDKKLLLVPEVYWDYCNEKIMVMERMNGIPVSDITSLKKNKIDIKKLARNGVQIFFTQVFRDGFFHADMHPGNIQVARDGRYIALDFGIMGSLSNEDKHYLARNFVCFFKRDYRGVAEVHVESGWVPPETSIDDFENAIRSVCEPIFEKPLKEISFGKLLIRLFQTSRKFNMEIQPQLTMLQKTLLNVEGLGRDLDPDLDLWKTAQPFLEKWLKEETGPKKILKALKKEIPNWITLAPELPKIFHAYLKSNELNNNIQSNNYFHNTIDELIKAQKLNKIIFVIILLLFIILFFKLL